MVAARNNMHATFMPKPLYGENGSGMHVNQSLSRGDANAFFEPDDDLQLSEAAYGYIAGLLEHLPAVMAFTAPSPNSYQRLAPGLWASAFAAYGLDNREAAIRLASPVAGREAATANVEIKPVDVTSNPTWPWPSSSPPGWTGWTATSTPAGRRW